ncbi:hypothetical protein TFLX_03852 [Thermoflexales bacterium]|nr:hypothetical protein TFLX_03852 [Thermoflexales bacterium]
MPRIKTFTVFVVTLAVFFSGIVAVKAATQATFARFFLIFNGSQDSSHAWWQSSTVVDMAGGVHSVFYDSVELSYAYCSTDCSNPANWAAITVASLSSYTSLAHPSLAVDANNRPRLMWFDGDGYRYAECNANCASAANWTAVQVPVADAEWGAPYPKNGRYFALDTQGRPRFAIEGLRYTTCEANCTTASNWSSARLAVNEYGLYYPQLVFNPNDQPRLLGYDSQDRLVYLECSSSCGQVASWNHVTLPYSASSLFYDSNFSFRLDGQGRPRLAFYDLDTGGTTLRYAWSNANSLTTAGWSSYGLPYAPADDHTVDLAIDSQNRPRVAFGSETEDLSYGVCTVNCETANPTWQRQDIETGDELNLSDPIPTNPGCMVSTWMLGEYPSLALDNADRPHVSYYARHVQGFCGGTSSYNDAWAIRFARPSGSTPPAPPVTVGVNGPALGVINTSYTFTATVSPVSATTPITYVWQATGLAPQTHTGRGINDTVTFTWPAGATGMKTISVSATNRAGTKQGSRTILITATPIVFNHWVYLPMTVR